MAQDQTRSPNQLQKQTSIHSFLRIAIVSVGALLGTVMTSTPAAATGDSPNSMDVKHNVTEVDFKDSFGNGWRRWVIVEDFDDRALLLVVENPVANLDDNSVSQVTIARKFYSSRQRAELNKQIAYYSSLKDVSQRTAEYYRPLNQIHAQTAKPLWKPSKTSWTLADEKDFADWYTANVTVDFFKGEGIQFDCADFGLMVRWAYAHDKKLPIANTVGGSNKLFGHFSGRSDWDKLKTDSNWRKDERFKTAIKYLQDATYTHTIKEDLYPVELNTTYVTPGSILLVLYSNTSGHTQVINKIGKQSFCGDRDCLTVLYGNEPARDIAFESTAWIQNLGVGKGGFLRWRWPVLSGGKWKLTNATKMPGYSLDQYNQPDMSHWEYEKYAQEQLGIVIPIIDKIWVLYNTIENAFSERKGVTAEGYINCSLQYCDPAGELYDALSTPSKDRRIRENIAKFQSLVAQLDPAGQEYLDLLSSLSSYLVFWDTGVPATFYDYIFNVNGVLDAMSSDPSKTYLERWGLAANADTDAMLWNTIFSRAWWSRRRLVYQSAVLCHPETSPLSCDPSSSEVKAVSTQRFDDGFRLFYKMLKANIPNVSIDVLTRVIEASKTEWVNSQCEWNAYSDCHNFDYLFNNTSYIDNLSSNPAHLERRRDGFLN